MIDWKSPAEQLNSYGDVTGIHRGRVIGDPFQALAGIYPDEALAEMAGHYQQALAA